MPRRASAPPAGRRIPLETVQFWVAMDDVGRLLALVDAASQLDLDAVVPAPLRAGGATMHSYGTPHMSTPNRSADRPRRAYIFNLASERGLRSMAPEG
jgi:hypothetical protein